MQEQKQVWIAPIVREQLDIVKKRVLTKDMDWVSIIDGEEGVGKSVLAQQLASYLDPDFNEDKIVFNSDTFIKLIKNPKTKKGSAIIMDETFSAANNRSSLTEVNRAMIGIATEMRQRNLFVFMCIPSFFDLDRYFALWRCKALFHVYFGEKDIRRYVIFPKEHKKLLYLQGKRFYNYRKPHSPFPPFTFSNTYMVNEQEYRKRKEIAFTKRTVSFRAQQWLKQRNAYAKFVIQSMGLNQEDVAKIPSNYGAPSLSRQSIGLIMKELEQIDA